MTDLSTDFPGADLFESEFADPVIFTDPTYPEDDRTPYSEKSAGDKARSLIADKERFKEHAHVRDASATYALLEQSEAVDRQTAAIERQTAVLERQALLTERMLTEQRIHNQLLFFAMSPADFEPKRAVDPEPVDGAPARESVHTQMKRNLGIIAASPLAEAVSRDSDEL